MTPTRRADSDQGHRALDLGIVDGLVQSSFVVHAALTEIATEHELSIVQLRLLGILRDREPRMAQLAHVLGLTKSSVTGLVDRAARRGLVRRETIPVGDERAVHVVITDRGRELIDLVSSQVRRQLGALVGDLSETDRKRLSLLLTRLVVHDADLQGVDLAPKRSTTADGRSR